MARLDRRARTLLASFDSPGRPEPTIDACSPRGQRDGRLRPGIAARNGMGIEIQLLDLDGPRRLRNLWRGLARG